MKKYLNSFLSQSVIEVAISCGCFDEYDNFFLGISRLHSWDGHEYEYYKKANSRTLYNLEEDYMPSFLPFLIPMVLLFVIPA